MSMCHCSASKKENTCSDSMFSQLPALADFKVPTCHKEMQPKEKTAGLPSREGRGLLKPPE